MVRTEEFSLNRCGSPDRADAVYAGVREPLVADDIADCIAWALTRPHHVNVDRLVVRPLAQAAQHKVAPRGVTDAPRAVAARVSALPQDPRRARRSRTEPASVRADGGGLAVEADAEALLHGADDAVGEGEQLGRGGAGLGGERQAVLGRRPDPAVAGAAAEAGVLHQPGGAELDQPVAGRPATGSPRPRARPGRSGW